MSYKSSRNVKIDPESFTLSINRPSSIDRLPSARSTMDKNYKLDDIKKE
jgi:hypothetical protein